MAAADHLSHLQFEYEEPSMGGKYHGLAAKVGGETVGHLTWSPRSIIHIGVGTEHQRQGVATAMFKHAQGLARSNQKIPQPQHSDDRTDAGDAWARKVGGRLPRRTSIQNWED